MPPSPASSAPIVQLLPFALSQDEGGVRFIGQGAWISFTLAPNLIPCVLSGFMQYMH